MPQDSSASQHFTRPDSATPRELPTPLEPRDAAGSAVVMVTLSASMLPPPPSAQGAALEVPGYDILGELGRGGMGIVYQARQRKLDRIVALKMILARDIGDGDLYPRFQMESQAIAQLQHPNIVQVHEAGQHQGQPYFTLEYLEGGSLARKVRSETLTALDAARTVEPLARGMAYAHEHGIVHRDLKPENVLLAADGTPKITDFGLAKRVRSATDSFGDALTERGAVLGTPSYMSPEQARGDAVGAATDIYALGAILYRLLTGRPPFQAATPMETLVSVMQEDTLPPSQLVRRLPRDLETICLTCLHKDPARRYPSALALAEDLRRFQAGEPILARAVGRGERLWKWARRRPAVATLSAALALALVVGFSLVTWKWLDEQTARELAEAKTLEAERNEGVARLAQDKERLAREQEKQQKQKALEQRDLALKYFGKAQDAVKKMLTEVSQDEGLLRNEPRFEQVRKKLLEKALAYYQEFLGEQASDPALRLATSAALGDVAAIQEELGSKHEAEGSYRTALRMLRDLNGEFPGTPDYEQMLGRICHNLAMLLRSIGKMEEAESLYREARQLNSKLAAAHPETASYRVELATVCNNLGSLLMDTGRLPEAEKLFRAAELQCQLLLDSAPAAANYHAQLAQTWLSLALLYTTQDQLDEAEKLYRLAHGRYQLLVDQRAGHPGHRQNLVRTCNSLAVLLRHTGRMGEAEKLYRQARDLCAQLVKDFPGTAHHRQSLAMSCTNLANLLRDNSRPAQAEKLYEEAGDLYRKLADDFPTVVSYRQDLAITEYNQGNLCYADKRLAEAEKLYRSALDLCEKLAHAYPQVAQHREHLANICNNLGSLLKDTKQPQEAEERFAQARNLCKQLMEEFPSVATYRQMLAMNCINSATFLRSMNRLPEAEKLSRQACDEFAKLTEEFPTVLTHRQYLAMSCYNLGNLLSATHRLPEAEKSYQKALVEFQRLADGQPKALQFREYLGIAYMDLGLVLERAGRPGDAEPMFRHAFWNYQQLLQQQTGPLTFEVQAARTLYMLALLQQKQKSWNQARPVFEHALKRFDRVLQRDPKHALGSLGKVGSLLGLAECCVELGRHEDAAAAVDDSAVLLGKDTRSLVRAAVLLARCIPLAGAGERAGGYGDRTVELLQRAIAAGYRGVDNLKNNPAFAPLRERVDFQEMIRALDKDDLPPVS